MLNILHLTLFGIFLAQPEVY